MGEVFRDRLDRSLANISKGREGKINVDDKRKFVGLDAYKQVLDSGVDVVILTTPPDFVRCISRPPWRPANTSSWKNPWPPMHPACGR